MNATFHAIPRLSTVLGWRERTPDDFVFALKTPRAITHESRLNLDDAEPLVLAFLQAAAELGPKLGPILIQLPPSFDRTPANRVLLARYLDRMPADKQRFAVEFRHPTWADSSVEGALRDRNVAWVMADGGANHQVTLLTADFAYVRWGRSGQEFPDFSTVRLERSHDLDWWASTLKALPSGIGTVYGYMSDEFAGHAPASLRQIQARLGIPTIDPKSKWPQPSLF